MGSYPGVGAVAGFPYTAVHTPVVGYSHFYGKREAEAEPYTVGQIAAGHHIANAPVVHHGVVGYAGYHPYVYGKREAEAEPYYGYTAGVVPYVHHAAVVAPTGLGHAVAVTGYGHVTHSSNVGVCTNVAGVQVPC